MLKVVTFINVYDKFAVEKKVRWKKKKFLCTVSISFRSVKWNLKHFFLLYELTFLLRSWYDILIWKSIDALQIYIAFLRPFFFFSLSCGGIFFSHYFLLLFVVLYWLMNYSKGKESNKHVQLRFFLSLIFIS